MSNTATRILDIALTLIQTRGFSAISYKDIAEQLGIRKASIHYHFPSKSDLGVAVVDRYAAQLTERIFQAQNKGPGSWKLLETYLEPYREFGNSSDRICLCGALAGEFLALPVPVQERVTEFFEFQQKWLENLLQNGRREGEFEFNGAAKKEARLTFSALQGALLVKRSLDDTHQLEDVISNLKKRLKPSR